MKRSAKVPSKTPSKTLWDKGTRVVTADEALLWDHATKRLDPVKAKPRVNPARKGFEPAPAASQPLRRATSVNPSNKHPPSGANLPQPTRPRASPPLADFDRRKARQIASGKAEVDARIDLHGLDQREAYRRLRGFLADAHARGDRLVLVITGKGGGEALDRLGELAGERRRGVLRRNLPQWLEEPHFREIVSSFTPAGARHGGAGALYVQLRRGR
ncbi:MAG TPA: Smr/MutS family protein [Hyphomicrobiaceae bacterium]|nr:Smr/MutS family protein [Hyphomicrobiaceae bacterium]